MIIKLIIQILCLHFIFSVSYSQIPHIINLQGVLLDNQLSPMQGTKLLKTSIYDKYSGGAPLYSQEDQVTLLPGGVYNILLGKDTSRFKNISFNKPLFIQVDVDNVVSTERIPLTSTPYAFMAHKVQDSSISEIHLDSNLIKKINDSYIPNNGKYIGEMKYWNGKSWETIIPGKLNDLLRLCQGNTPQWGPCPEIPDIKILYNRTDQNQIYNPNQIFTTSYLTRDRIKLTCRAFDRVGREPLQEVGIIFGSKPNLTMNDSIVKTNSIGTTEQIFDFVIGDLINRKKTYVRAYAKNRAGIVFSDEYLIYPLSHSISDSAIQHLPEWLIYDTSRKSFMYLISQGDSLQKKIFKDVYTYSEINKSTKKSLSYDINNIGPMNTNLKGSFVTVGNELHIYDYNFWRSNDSLFQISKIKIDSNGNFSNPKIQLKYPSTSINYPYATRDRGLIRGDYLANDLYCLLNDNDTYRPLLTKLENGETLIKKFEFYHDSIPSTILKTTLCIVEDGFVTCYGNSIKKYSEQSYYPIESLTITSPAVWEYNVFYDAGDSPTHVIRSTKLNAFYYVHWKKRELYKISKDLVIEKKYQLPDIPGIDLLSKNNCIILEQQGNLRLFIPSYSGGESRILSYDIID